ncbi:MAG: adenylosuccinate synthase [Acidobacteria bacterium]|nr:adenylosuccinate synthase [Acidobacteriota bacterium]MCB9396391.1 adenylosuccinate synthase [Acidobacteriota bacterium]
MRNIVVAGAQWGDEGKGKVVDLIAGAFDLVVRFQGGNNAGHSVEFGGKRYALHLLPSGVFHAGTQNLIGNGVVVDPKALLSEIDKLNQQGVSVNPDNLKLSDRAQIVMPYHIVLDRFREASADRKIGTTGKGIGPAYEFKAARRGIRFCDVGHPAHFQKRVAEELSGLQSDFPLIPDLQALQVDTVLAELAPVLERLAPFIVDGVVLANREIAAGKRVLFEGAQATLLDLDFGTYPYVTSSNSCAVGVPAGCGVAPQKIDAVIGITKAYCTRVGEGPFPSELNDALGEQIRKVGNEFGTTTGRPRRCGWLDLVALKYAHTINAFDSLALMKMDVLNDLDEVWVCDAYDQDGLTITDFPASLEDLKQMVPRYKRFAGWKQSLAGVHQYDALPPAALAVIRYIETYLGCSVDLVSTGPDRTQTLLKPGSLMARLAEQAN